MIAFTINFHEDLQNLYKCCHYSVYEMVGEIICVNNIITRIEWNQIDLCLEFNTVNTGIK